MRPRRVDRRPLSAQPRERRVEGIWGAIELMRGCGPAARCRIRPGRQLPGLRPSLDLLTGGDHALRRHLQQTLAEAAEAADTAHAPRRTAVQSPCWFRTCQAMRDWSDHSSMKPGDAACEKRPAPSEVNVASCAS